MYFLAMARELDPKGKTVQIHAVLCAAGYNIRWLLRMILKKGIGPFFASFSRSSFRSYRQSVRVGHGRPMPEGADFNLSWREN
jgi:hypothetical protein